MDSARKEELEGRGVDVRRIDRLDALVALAQEMQRRNQEGATWIFRGATDASRPLRSSLDRLHERWQWPRDKSELELGLLRMFRRHLPLYHAEHSPPADGDLMEWLALMRHWGAPSRLLDFSYSIWNAVFFAFEDVAPAQRTNPAVWAIELQWLKEAALHRLETVYGISREVHERDQHARDPRTFRALYIDPRATFVLAQNSWRQHRRLFTQQGVFLCPGNLDVTFEENLFSLEPAADQLAVIEIEAALALDVQRALRPMNISSATMFPGFEGFVRSLANLAAIPDLVAPAGVCLLDELFRPFTED